MAFVGVIGYGNHAQQHTQCPKFRCSVHTKAASTAGRVASNPNRHLKCSGILKGSSMRAVKSCPTSPTRSIDTNEQNARSVPRADPCAYTPRGFVCDTKRALVLPNSHTDKECRPRATALIRRNTSTGASYTFATVPNSETPSTLGDVGISQSVPKLIPAKRSRPFHDVDGPRTDSLACKKRRLRRHLTTSRLSLPFSIPATHILNRESDDEAPFISRFLKAAAIGARRAGHEAALVRKAAILNSVRLRVQQTAVARGHTGMAGLASRSSFLSHGHQVVTAPTVIYTGSRYPVSKGMPGHQRLPYAWRPHATMSPGINPIAVLVRPAPASTERSVDPVAAEYVPARTSPPPPPVPFRSQDTSPPPRSLDTASSKSTAISDDSKKIDDGYGMAFPSSELDLRYADLSDDDMDDVYADFSTMFSPRSSRENSEGSTDESAPARSGGPVHFYEEYLDELDGIPWMS